MMRRIVVVGGGLAGLTAAYRLTQQLPRAEITVLEASEHVGGLLRTETTDGFVVDRGPDSILTEKSDALDLATEVGLGDQIMSTQSQHRGAHVVCHGELKRIPAGFSVVGTSDIEALRASSILSKEGITRVAQEPELAPKADKSEESLAAFVTRRYGAEFLDRLAQPMAGGIYGADPTLLSMQAALPMYAALEKQHGSITAALRKRQQDLKEQASGARYGMFVSFRDGMQTLPDRLAELLGDGVIVNAKVSTIGRTSTGQWSVKLELGTPIEADALVLALPAWASAGLLRSQEPALGEALDAIDYGDAATVTFAWPKAVIGRPLDAFGFVVPAIEGLDIMASTWSSVKWAGRAPDDHALIRVFLGGPGREDVLNASDSKCIDVARRALKDLMQVDAEPTLTRMQRWPAAMPRYFLGHLDRVAAIEAAVARVPNITLAGNAYHGVGIPDTVRSAQRAAMQLLS